MTNRTHPPVASPEILDTLMEAGLAVAGSGDDPLGPVVAMSTPPTDHTEAIQRITENHEVHALLLAGHTPHEIAHHLTVKYGRRITSKEVDAMGDVVAKENIERTTSQKASIFQREVDRIEVMIKALWPQCQDGNHQAIDRMIKLQQRKADLLGLDQPDVRVSLTLGGSEVDYTKLTTEELVKLKELNAKAARANPERVVTGTVK